MTRNSTIMLSITKATRIPHMCDQITVPAYLKELHEKQVLKIFFVFP